MNKKNIIIPISLLLGVLTLGMASNAYALTTQQATNVSFNISADTVTYYLKGTFNSFSENDDYRFVNATAEMTPEVNKVKEYKLENIIISKDAQLRVEGNDGSIFKDGADDCSYSHHWSNEIQYSGDSNHYYIAPMTSNTYTFYLKFYSDDSSQLYITANKDVLFFKPSEDWKTSEAKFRVLQYSANSDESWVQDVTPTSVSEGVYRFDIGHTYSYYKFARRNPADDNTWNASSMLQIYNDDANNYFALNEGLWSDWNAGNGSWGAR